MIGIIVSIIGSILAILTPVAVFFIGKWIKNANSRKQQLRQQHQKNVNAVISGEDGINRAVHGKLGDVQRLQGEDDLRGVEPEDNSAGD